MARMVAIPASTFSRFTLHPVPFPLPHRYDQITSDCCQTTTGTCTDHRHDPLATRPLKQCLNSVHYTLTPTYIHARHTNRFAQTPALRTKKLLARTISAAALSYCAACKTEPLLKENPLQQGQNMNHRGIAAPGSGTAGL